MLLPTRERRTALEATGLLSLGFSEERLGEGFRLLGCREGGGIRGLSVSS